MYSMLLTVAYYTCHNISAAIHVHVAVQYTYGSSFVYDGALGISPPPRSGLILDACAK